MCDQVSYDRIKDAVTFLVSTGQPFTAFDVTKHLRNLYTDFQERHKTVRTIIHSMFSNDELCGYVRTLTSLKVPNGNVDAFVFHPAMTDPSVYPLTDKTFIPSVGAPTGVVSLDDSIADPPLFILDNPTEKVTLTSDNRLHIPKRLLDMVTTPTIDIQINGQVFVYNRNADGRVRLTCKNPAKRTFDVAFDPKQQAIVIT